MKERLTHKARYEAGYKANRDVPVWECVDRLGQLEDLEEKAMLIKFPCNVGDAVYSISTGKITEVKVLKFEIEKSDADSFTMQIWFDNFEYCFFHHFGTTVFLDRTQAEQALSRKG